MRKKYRMVMCDDEIEEYFHDDGCLIIKSKWEREHKTFIRVLTWSLLIVFFWIPLLSWLFDKLMSLFELLDTGLVYIKYSIERHYFARKYLSGYIIPTKKEVQEYFKRSYEVEE